MIPMTRGMLVNINLQEELQPWLKMTKQNFKSNLQ